MGKAFAPLKIQKAKKQMKKKKSRKREKAAILPLSYLTSSVNRFLCILLQILCINKKLDKCVASFLTEGSV